MTTRLAAKRPVRLSTDPELEAVESVIAQVRACPADYADETAVVRLLKMSAKRAYALFREHYHATAAELLLRARLKAGKTLLLTTGKPLAAIAREVGFSASAELTEPFSQRNGLTLNAYRQLGAAQNFTIRLPAGYPLNYLRRALSRDDQSVTERLEGDRYQAAIRLGREAHLLALSFSPGAVTASVNPPTAEMPRVHALVIGLLGLEQDTAAFSEQAKALGLQRLVAHCPDLRIHQTHSVFDGLLWAIIGQQINLAFAYRLRRRFFELTGTPVGEGLIAPPTPETVAVLQHADLLPLQFSRQKADYVISTSRLIAEGKLDLGALRALSATQVKRTLLAVRGLGVWSVNYLMMRSLGFADCLPLGDTGVTSGLQVLFDLKIRPNPAVTLRLTAPFSPWRSLATAHLWQFNRPIPE